MEWPLAGRDAIWMAGIDNESLAATLQDNARLRRHETSPKAVKHCVDEATSITVFINHRNIDSVLMRWQGCRR